MWLEVSLLDGGTPSFEFLMNAEVLLAGLMGYIMLEREIKLLELVLGM